MRAENSPSRGANFEPVRDSLAVYIHWPYCLAKCPYCDFNSHVAARIDHRRWREAYARDMAHQAALAPGRLVTSVFFGGGTPSLMEPDTVGGILNEIARHWDVAEDCEITLEANPTSVEIDKFKAFRAAGINRVSLGVQALNDSDLRFLGRQHDAAEARLALDTANACFDRVSFDLIYARPGQDVAAWEAELDQALGLAGGHMSLYQLTIEPGTAFHTQYHRGDFKLPDEIVSAELFALTNDRMADAGLPGYEVSNHAAPGQESRHNLAYWRYQDYVGIGPGAHGRLTLDGVKQATTGHRAPELWLQWAETRGHGMHPFEAVDARGRFTEALMMGLRLREGVALSRLEAEGGAPLDVLIDPRKLDSMRAEGYLELADGRLRATPAGLVCLNSVLSYLARA